MGVLCLRQVNNYALLHLLLFFPFLAYIRLCEVSSLIFNRELLACLPTHDPRFNPIIGHNYLRALFGQVLIVNIYSLIL